MKSLREKLHHKHLEDYLLWDPYQHYLCGPCFFRDGFQTELPSRVTIREGTGNYGAPAIDYRFIEHVEVSLGLVPPDPGEPLPQWRKRRDRLSSRPNPKLFPFISSLWNLMNFQPPLAKPLIRFCQGMDEVEIAEELDLSLYNVHERLVKAVRTGQGFLKYGKEAH
jgi:hypothetical protein